MRQSEVESRQSAEVEKVGAEVNSDRMRAGEVVS